MLKLLLYFIFIYIKPNRMNKTSFLACILLLIFTSCRNTANDTQVSMSNERGRMEHLRSRLKNAQNHVESGSVITGGDTVFVPSGSAILTKMKTYTVNPQQYTVQFTTTGVVKPIAGHKAEVAAPFEGRIVKSFIKLGQKVTTGTPLFQISSSDYLESVRMFHQAGRERELAERNYLRKKELMEKGISSSKEYDEAKLEFDLADKEYEKTAEILKIFNLDPCNADLGSPLIVRSPISGEVVKTDIVVGQYIKADSDPVVIIADLNKIWVIASVKEKDLGAVNNQDQVEIFTASMPERSLKGSVDYIGNIMNEQTRSVEVYIKCDNPGQVLKCGMFVTTRFYHRVNDAIIIPSGSVLQGSDRPFLFVQIEPGTYIKRNITVTSLPENKMIVHHELKPGEVIVSDGGIYLQ